MDSINSSIGSLSVADRECDPVANWKSDRPGNTVVKVRNICDVKLVGDVTPPGLYAPLVVPC